MNAARFPGWTWLALLVFAVVVRVFAANSVNVAMDDDARASIQLTPVTDFWDGIGFLAVAVRIENNADEPRTWELDFMSGGVYGYGTRARFPVAFTAPPRGVRETVVFVPGAGPGGNNYSTSVLVIASGSGVRSSGNASLVNGRRNEEQPIAVSSRLEGVARDYASSTHTRSGQNFPIEVIDPARWPADWRVWSAFRSLQFRESEFLALDGARRAAILDWVAQGGQLHLCSSGAERAGDEAHVAGSVRRQRDVFDSGDIGRNASGPTNRGAPWGGLGRLITEADRGDLELVRDAVWIIPFLVVFGLLVGPINVFVFAPASRRQRLFFTVPLMSLVASLLIGAFIVLRDGFGGEGTRRAFVLLVAGENKAVVFQQQLARTGVLTGDAFPLAADTVAVDEAESSNDSARDLVRRGDEASGDWFASRALPGQNFRRIVPTRARVELVGGGSGGAAPVVQSTFTTVLKDFVYIDAGGVTWSAFELMPGARVELQRRPPEIALTRHVTPNETGWFYAVGGPSDLAPIETLDSITWSTESIVYAGKLEKGGRP